jgi:hypothetical protein
MGQCGEEGLRAACALHVAPVIPEQHARHRHQQHQEGAGFPEQHALHALHFGQCLDPRHADFLAQFGDAHGLVQHDGRPPEAQHEDHPEPHAGEDGHASRLARRPDAQRPFAVHVRHSSAEGKARKFRTPAWRMWSAVLPGPLAWCASGAAQARPLSNCAVLLQ